MSSFIAKRREAMNDTYAILGNKVRQHTIVGLYSSGLL